MEVLNNKFDKLYPDKESSILAVSTETPALQCLKKFRELNIFCFPVVNPEHKSKLVGLVDLIDIAAYVLDMWDSQSRYDNAAVSSVTFDLLFNNMINNKTVSDFMNFSKMNDCHYLSENATFKDVLKTLSQPGVRRVPMMGSKHGLFNPLSKRPLERFLTQTDVLHFVAQNMHHFGSALEQSVINKVGTYPALCVHQSMKTVEAFRLLISNKVTGMGVIDDDKNLIGELSIRDFGYVVTTKPGTELSSTVADFIAHLRESNVESKVLTCGPKDSVGSVIQKIESNRSHRIYVINSENKPCGVISLSDICLFLLQLPPQPKKGKKETKEGKGTKAQ